VPRQWCLLVLGRHNDSLLRLDARKASFSYDTGFASHRRIRFADHAGGATLIEVSDYSVGRSDSAMFGQNFVKWLTERWIGGFARFCEERSGASIG
jgi:hypothetical protein